MTRLYATARDLDTLRELASYEPPLVYSKCPQCLMEFLATEPGDVCGYCAGDEGPTFEPPYEELGDVPEMDGEYPW